MKRRFSDAGIVVVSSAIMAIIVFCIVMLVNHNVPEKAAPVAVADTPVQEVEDEPTPTFETEDEVWEHLRRYAAEKGYDINDYPEKSGWLLVHSPDEYSYLIDYPAKKQSEPNVDIEKYRDTDTVPLFIQWDEQWGYARYGDEGTIGVNGCGVVCLSMVAVYLTGDTRYDPVYMAKYAEDKHYYINGSGTTWDLFNNGGAEFGIESKIISLSESKISDAVQNGHPVVLNVAEGDFTTSGHYIVLTGYENGKFKVNDPNSTIISAQLWDWDTLLPQIKNAWEFYNKYN